MNFRELTREEFDIFTTKFKEKSTYQTSEYGYIMNNQDYQTMFVGLIENSSVIAASLLLINKIGNFNYAYAPRGFLLDYKDENLLKIFTQEIKKFLGKKEIVAVKISPMIIKTTYNRKGEVISENQDYNRIFDSLKKIGYYHFGYNNFFEAHKPRFEAVLPIQKNYIFLFRNIKKEFRTKIRSAEKRGIQIFKGKEEELDVLYNHIKNKYPRNETYLKDTYRFFDKNHKVDFYYAKLDTSVYLKGIQQDFEKQDEIATKINSEVIKNAKKNSSKLIAKKIDSDQLLNNLKNQLIKATRMASEYPDGVIIASTLIIKNQAEITLLMDGFDPKFKSLNAKHLLLWKIIEKYSKLGYQKLNMGGVTNINISNKKYDGLNEFKLNFNSNVIEYIGDLELVTNNALYFMYKGSKQFKQIIKKG